MDPPEEWKRISAAREDAPVRGTARAGRAAWGVLGSAAGGHVFVLERKNPAAHQEFRKNPQKT